MPDRLETELIALAASGEFVPVDTRDVSPACAAALQALLEVDLRADRAVARLKASGRADAIELIRTALETVPSMSVEEVMAKIRARNGVEAWRSAAQRILRIRPDPEPRFALSAIEAIASEAFAVCARDDEAVRTLEMFAQKFRSSFDDAEQYVVPSGLPGIDDLLGGWALGHLHLVTGLTGSGKTALLVQTAVHAAELGHEVHLVSAEMPGETLVPRALGEYLSVYATSDGSKVTVGRTYRRDPAVKEAFEAALRDAQDAFKRIVVDARGWVTLRDVLSMFYRHHAVRPVRLLLVDYLQLIQPEEPGRNREQEVAEVAIALKRLAVRHNVAVVAAAQLVDPPAWSGEAQRSKTPAVRESRAAAHAADLVIELQRGREGNDRLPKPEERYTIRITKSRHAAAEGYSREVVFDRGSCRFKIVEAESG
jgi:replicative DNA helicase